MRLLVLLAAGLPSACGGLPALEPVTPAEATRLQRACEVVFPPGSWTAIHALEVDLPLGSKGAVLGISAWDARSEELQSAMVTAEGLVLFEAALRGGRIRVQRAFPPLDSRSFARRLFSDVRLMLVAPRGFSPTSGRIGGQEGCRFRSGRRTIDLLLAPGGTWRLVDYGEGGSPLREVRAFPPVSGGFARVMVLVSRGVLGYRMRLELVEARQGDAGQVP